MDGLPSVRHIVTLSLVSIEASKHKDAKAETVSIKKEDVWDDGEGHGRLIRCQDAMRIGFWTSEAGES